MLPRHRLLMAIIASGFIAYGFTVSESIDYAQAIQFGFLFLGFFLLILLLVLGKE
ncbi:MAG: hypothetical protein ABIH41_04280 [Nanoarchaeota archaeon]